MGYWVKKLNILHVRTEEQLNEIVNGHKQLPEWMTYGRTVLCQKDQTKGNAEDTCRPISYLLQMWKSLTGLIAGNMYEFLEREHTISDEQKGCLGGTK